MLHSKVDLNLFLVLKTVYLEGSITAAAKKLHLTQPAVSHAIGRLRAKFDEPLFVRHGRKMVPSAFCQKIMPQVIAAVDVLELTFLSNKEFDVTEHRREIKFGFRDILESLFFPALMSDLLVNSPNITVNSRKITRPKMEKSLADHELDIVIDVLVPTGDDICHQLICEESFSLICRAGHPILDDLTLDNYVNASHALVALKDSEVDLVDIALAKHGVSRRVVLQCEHYFAAASVIAQSDMLLTMPNSYVNLLIDKMAVCAAPLPFQVAAMPVHMYWHKQAEHDPANGWMREKLLNIAKEIL